MEPSKSSHRGLRGTDVVDMSMTCPAWSKTGTPDNGQTRHFWTGDASIMIVATSIKALTLHVDAACVTLGRRGRRCRRRSKVPAKGLGETPRGLADTGEKARHHGGCSLSGLSGTTQPKQWAALPRVAPLVLPSEDKVLHPSG